MNVCFLTKIGKSLMFPIATLPAAALLLRLGSGDMLGAVPNEAIQYIASIMAASGNAILGNLPIILPSVLRWDWHTIAVAAQLLQVQLRILF